MGKYMKKTKITGEVSVMEVPHQFSLGVRTRARTLALQRLQRAESTSSYLQLRSRRLEKPPVPKPRDNALPNPNPTPTHSPSPSPYPSPRSSHSRLGSVVGSVSAKASPENEAGLEVSFGENVLEVEARSRNARETTPCSLIRDSETVETPGSTTRPTNSTARRPQRSVRRDIPTAQEMEEFFAGAEKLQQKMFAEKYNFDPVNDRPLAGRYEWVKLDD